eukprot:3726754-Rhodomonas_salina.1
MDFICHRRHPRFVEREASEPLRGFTEHAEPKVDKIARGHKVVWGCEMVIPRSLNRGRFARDDAPFQHLGNDILKQPTHEPSHLPAKDVGTIIREMTDTGQPRGAEELELQEADMNTPHNTLHQVVNSGPASGPGTTPPESVYDEDFERELADVKNSAAGLDAKIQNLR